MRKEARGRCIITQGVRKYPTPRKLVSIFVTERAVKMTRAILFELSRRIVIDRAVDTAIDSTTDMLVVYRFSVVPMLRACLNWYFAALRAQTSLHKE